MDYQKIKDELDKIIEVVSVIPDQYKEKCFEVLLQRILYEQDFPSQKLEQNPQIQPPKNMITAPSQPPFPSCIKVFMRKYDVAEDEIASIIFYEMDEVYFVHEPKTTIVGQGQIEWALLLALKSAILKNEFIVDPEDVRSVCKEKGFYDASNFAANFKYSANKSLFRGLMKPQGDSQLLTEAGLSSLSKLIKTYSSKS